MGLTFSGKSLRKDEALQLTKRGPLVHTGLQPGDGGQDYLILTVQRFARYLNHWTVEHEAFASQT
jgi:hypothetical protein